MPFYPTVPESVTTQQVVDTFMGYNHGLKIGEGELFVTQNLTSDYFPLLANRGKRGIVKNIPSPGGMLAKEHLAYVSAGKLYYNGEEVPGITLTDGEKQLVSMGSYLVIWPDKVYVNTADLSDKGSMDNNVLVGGDIRYWPCDENGNEVHQFSARRPEAPVSGDYWLDTNENVNVLKKFNADTGTWMEIKKTYVSITAPGISEGFHAGDGVQISGVTPPVAFSKVQTDMANALNGTLTIFEVGDDYIKVPGLIPWNFLQQNAVIRVSRSAPDMDFITEAGNRIWGCKFGVVDGKNINEIYCCALGDFKNWSQFKGISTDSYVASVGTDGPWTGAITHLGSPIFFKENVMHKVYVSSSGAHQINDTACRGVQNGCSKSLAIVGEVLYYKSNAGIMMYDGSLPENVSDALGGEKFYDAVAGAIGEKYYISMRGSDGAWNLFVLDTKRGMWLREDDTHAASFASNGDELFFINGETGDLTAVNGSEGTPERDVEWSATTGLIGYSNVEQKYVSRFNIRMVLPRGSSANLFIEYDSSGVWEFCGHMVGHGTGTFTLPVRPRRCDHFRFRMEGEGDVRVYSFAKVFEAGSDVS